MKLKTCTTCNHRQCKECLGNDLWEPSRCTNHICTTSRLLVKFGKTERQIDVWNGISLIDIIGQVAE